MTVRGGADMTSRYRLASVLAPELVEAVEELVAQRVASALAHVEASGPEWLTLDQAAERLGCTRDAVRMRANRGRLTRLCRSAADSLSRP
jgi:DNA-directed RNA polymerase specialized sigma24 family protein